MNKVKKDGKVAVLISPGFGAGWSTWASDEHKETMLFDADIVAAVLDGDMDRAAAIASQKCDGVYTGGAHDLQVVWVTEGQPFAVHEYDGAESIQTEDPRRFVA